MKPTNWYLVFVLAIIVGVLAGYVAALVWRPGLLPPMLRLGLMSPTTVLFLGTDVVYQDHGRRRVKADPSAFTGRSDTIMVARLDPYRNAIAVLSIPRDTQVQIPHNGTQKINAANAIGGPNLAIETVSNFLQLPIDHYVILNVHGLVELVDELGGITVEVPKKMQYMDWTAKLKIDLEPGPHTLTGNQAMGFVRYRHDALGDIGRVQRQSIFMRAVLDKALKPESWGRIHKLIEIAQKHIQTDLSNTDMLGMAWFVRGVPKKSQYLAMMPGAFSGSGDWVVERSDVRRMVARLLGSSFIVPTRDEIRICIENASSVSNLGSKLSKMLRKKGYRVCSIKDAEDKTHPLKHSRIIAQRANPEDADLVKSDLNDKGEIVNASVGDIESSVTIRAGEDLIPLVGGDK